MTIKDVNYKTGDDGVDVAKRDGDEEEIVVAGATTTSTAAAGDGDGADRRQEYADKNKVDWGRFSDVFYCPLTKEIMTDPVVDRNGDSFERKAVVLDGMDEETAAEQYYPNRALKSVIDKTIARKQEERSVRGFLTKVDEDIRSGWRQVVEKSAWPSREYRPLPDVYYCPITCDLMHSPVIDKDGNTFEKVAVENWIVVNGKSPVTRNPMSLEDLRPNRAVEDLLEEEKSRSDDSIHPSIRRFKLTAPPLPIPRTYPAFAVVLYTLLLLLVSLRIFCMPFNTHFLTKLYIVYFYSFRGARYSTGRRKPERGGGYDEFRTATGGSGCRGRSGLSDDGRRVRGATEGPQQRRGVDPVGRAAGSGDIRIGGTLRGLGYFLPVRRCILLHLRLGRESQSRQQLVPATVGDHESCQRCGSDNNNNGWEFGHVTAASSCVC